jgi:uncharacterized protein YegP (UPF0339 family)
MRIDMTRTPQSRGLRLALCAFFLTAAGCSDKTLSDKRDDPALKASTQKSVEIYKSKTQAKKGTQAVASTQRATEIYKAKKGTQAAANRMP